MFEEPVSSLNAAKLTLTSKPERYTTDKNIVKAIEEPPSRILGARMIGSSDENTAYSYPLRRRKPKPRSPSGRDRAGREKGEIAKGGVLYTIKSRGEVYHQWENPLLEKRNDIEKSTGAIIEIFLEKSVIFGRNKFKMDSSDHEHDIYSDSDDSGSVIGENVLTSFRDKILEGLESLQVEKVDKNQDDFETKDSAMKISKMHIYSGPLKDALREIVTYYPAQAMSGDWIVIDYPFKVLMHHYHDLTQLENQTLKAGQGQKVGYGGHSGLDEGSHLTILKNVLQPTYEELIKPVEERYKAGVTSYSMLWMLFKPGTDAYAKVGGKLEGFVISSTKQDGARIEIPEMNEQQWRRYWVVKAWKMTYVRGRVSRVYRTFKILKFRGEKEITSLPIFPSAFLDSADSVVIEKKDDPSFLGSSNLRKDLENRGKAFYEILKTLPVHTGYEGVAWDFKNYSNAWQRTPKLQYEGEVIIDPTAYLNNAAEMTKRVSSVRRGIESESDRDVEPTQGLEENTIWKDYDNIDPKAREQLTSHHYFLFPRLIDGYALKTKKWMSFDVGGLKPIKWSSQGYNALNQLILPRRDIEILKALASKQAKENAHVWGADFIEGKGEGQVILLHGPPGTGKTYTVECVADYTLRPLVVLTVADIGTNEVRMEENLSRWFTLAASWRAIILMDEADVFLEKRQVADLQRNSLVSVFLRCMEYYPGMLFLTTNRIGQIDDAFLSRTSVAITYNPLTSSVQAQIWDGFLQKLERERPDLVVTDRARAFLESDEEMRNVPWNGREIRNALQIAIDLAICDSEQDVARTGVKPSKIEIDKEHFLKVVLRRKSFIEYRNSIRRQTEEQRAQGEGSRAITPLLR